jgi:hypothetical protein
MEPIVACRACGCVLLQRLQSQHSAFHQHHGHIQTVEYTKPL